MAGVIHSFSTRRGFAGLTSIFQYTNADGIDPATVCGQAACATVLTYGKSISGSVSLLRRIEKSHPPDLLDGALGTSPWRIREILKHYGANTLHTVAEESKLKHYVHMKFPVICLIQNTEGIPGIIGTSHWFVVFAYDDNGVFVTNYTPTHLKWSSFSNKWKSPVPLAAQAIDFSAVVSASRILPDPIPIPTNVA